MPQPRKQSELLSLVLRDFPDRLWRLIQVESILSGRDRTLVVIEALEQYFERKPEKPATVKEIRKR
jgi:hypothetical protein